MTLAVLLCLVGLLLSFEYRGEKYHILLWGCRGLSLAAALAGDDTIRTGTRVGLMTGDDRFGLIALGAAGLAGGVVHVINPRMGPSDLAGSVRTGLDVIIHTADCQLGDYPGKRIAVGDLGALAGRARGWPVPHRARASRLVMLTSGTTGGPAAIPIRRRWSAPLPALALAGATGVRHGVPTLVCPPIFHGYGLALAMLCLVAGSPLVMGSRCRAAGMSEVIKGAAPGRTDWGRAIATVVEETGAGAVVAVPIQLRSLAAHLDGPPGGDPASEHGAARSATSESEYENAGSATSPTEHGTVRSVMPGSEHGTVRSVMPGSEHGTVRSATSGSEHGTVRSVMSGSDPLDPDTIRTIQRHWGPVVTNYYGSTETGPVALISRADLPGRPTSVGRPVAGTRIRIVGETGSPLSRGRTGRILIDSPLVSPGGEVGWRGSYVTSDRGWVDEEGYLYLTGRL